MSNTDKKNKLSSRGSSRRSPRASPRTSPRTSRPRSERRSSPRTPRGSRPNKALAELLSEIGEYYKYEKGPTDKYRSSVYLTAGSNIATYPEAIKSGNEARKLFTGIGPSVSADIDEYLKTGYITRLQTLRNTYDSKQAVVDMFITVHGIGPVSAGKFYDAGIRNFPDLLKSGMLTSTQRISVEYRDKLMKKIPRENMFIIESQIKDILFPKGISFAIVGSYRRGESVSSDIDVLIEDVGKYTFDEVISFLRVRLVADLSFGNNLYMGIYNPTSVGGAEGEAAHRIDIRYLPTESLFTGLLYFTGSKEFNVLLRERAKELGYTLNEYSLSKGTKKTPIKSEQDVFKHLGVCYYKPVERIREIKSLNICS